jgi:hypothetical protein
MAGVLRNFFDVSFYAFNRNFLNKSQAPLYRHFINLIKKLRASFIINLKSALICFYGKW